MSRLYDYCTKTNLHTKKFINELFLETYNKAKDLLSIWERRKAGTVFYEFDASSQISTLYQILNLKCYEQCSISEVGEVFDAITTDFSQELNELIDARVGIPHGCTFYFGINRYYEGILMFGKYEDVVFYGGPAFKAEGIKALR